MSSEMTKKVEAQINDLTGRLDQANRECQDMLTIKNRAAAENSELTRQLEEAEHRVGQLTKEKSSINHALEDAKRSLEDETRVSISHSMNSVLSWYPKHSIDTSTVPLQSLNEEQIKCVIRYLRPLHHHLSP